MTALALEKIWEVLSEVKDPEIPVVSLVEMGIVRAVAIQGEKVTVRMTPTFSGCPAMQVMQNEVLRRLQEAGAAPVEVEISHSPAWTTEWIAPEAREKLKAFGLAPPPRHNGNISLALLDIVTCPYCGSTDTSLKNSFGPTLCRAIYYCNACRQPFEQFKPL